MPKSGPRFNVYMICASGNQYGSIIGFALQMAFLSSVSRYARVCTGLACLFVANMTLFVAFFSATEPLTTNMGVVAFAFTLVGVGRVIAETNGQALFAAYGIEAQRFLNFGSSSAWTGGGAIYFTAEAAWGRTWVLSGIGMLTSCVVSVVGIVVVLMLPTPQNDDGYFEADADPCAEERSDDGNHDARELSYTFTKALSDMRAWHEWLPQTRTRIAIAAMASGLSGFAIALIQLLYAGSRQTMLPGVVVSPGAFMIIFCVVECAGGVLGSTLVPHLRYPDLFIAATSLVAIAFMASRVPLLGVLSSGLMWIAFTVSATLTSVAIATRANKKFTLTAMTLWLLLVSVSLVVAQIAAGSWSVIIGRVGESNDHDGS